MYMIVENSSIVYSGSLFWVPIHRAFKTSCDTRNEQFLLFLQCFLLYQIIVSTFVHIFDIISLFAADKGEPKIGISGKGLTLYQTTKVWTCRN